MFVVVKVVVDVVSITVVVSIFFDVLFITVSHVEAVFVVIEVGSVFAVDSDAESIVGGFSFSLTVLKLSFFFLHI